MINLVPVILIVFFLAALFRIAFIFHVLYVLIAVTVISRLWTRYTTQRLQVERRFDRRALYGDSITVRLTLRNNSALPVPWIRIRDRLPVALGTPGIIERGVGLGPRASAEFVVELSARQRGSYELGPCVLETGDVLGTTVNRVEFATPETLLVYPKILPLTALSLPSRIPFGSVRSRQLLYADPSRVVGVRSYQPGDSLRQIHWRTSAASGELQVKKLEPAMTLQTTIVLDLDSTAYDAGALFYATELAVVVAASLASDLVDKRQEVGLMTNGIDPLGRGDSGVTLLPARRSRDQLTRILDILARIQPGTVLPLDAVLESQVGRLGWGSTVVVVTGEGREDTDRAIRALGRAGFAAAIVQVRQPSVYGREEDAVGYARYVVWRESDVDATAGQSMSRRPVRLASG